MAPPGVPEVPGTRPDAYQYSGVALEVSQYDFRHYITFVYRGPDTVDACVTPEGAHLCNETARIGKSTGRCQSTRSDMCFHCVKQTCNPSSRSGCLFDTMPARPQSTEARPAVHVWLSREIVEPSNEDNAISCSSKTPQGTYAHQESRCIWQCKET